MMPETPGAPIAALLPSLRGRLSSRVLDDRSEHAGCTYILYQDVQYVYQLVSARISRMSDCMRKQFKKLIRV